MELKKHGLFNTMNTVEEAMQYADMVVGAMPEPERTPAYTAIYVLYNTVLKQYEETKQKEEV